MIQWLFRKKPENPRLSTRIDDLEERIATLERGLKGLKADLKGVEEGVESRFGKVWARFKTPKSDEQPEEVQLARAAQRSFLPPTHAEMQEMRQRHGLLRG